MNKRINKIVENIKTYDMYMDFYMDLFMILMPISSFSMIFLVSTILLFWFPIKIVFGIAVGIWLLQYLITYLIEKKKNKKL